MKFAKGYSQKDVDNYVAGVLKRWELEDAVRRAKYALRCYSNNLSSTTTTSTCSSTRTITIPYWFYEQK